MNNRAFRNALKLFDEEREALRTGALDRVAQIGAERDLILADLDAIRMSREQAVRLKEKATANAELLAAALAGVKDAQKRLAALEGIRRGLSVYTADGALETVAQKGGELHHKV